MSVEAWGDLAQECQQVLRKGQQVRVLGQVANATWTDAQTQQERRRMFIRARAIDRIAPYQAGNSYASAGTPQQSYDYATGGACLRLRRRASSTDVDDTVTSHGHRLHRKRSP